VVVRSVAAIVLFASSVAAAQTVDPPPPPTPRLTVAVGKTLEVDVGWHAGWFCDNSKLITGNLVTRKVGDRETNVWIIKGVKAGQTECRVGRDPQRVNLVFDLVVTPAPKSAR
jgi:hypothetical protein